jgi:predicted AlkP superfamily pyrophosphatase or phosphodiesterase
MKLFILALDGLDYKLVSMWKLRNLMQLKNGYFKVPSCYNHTRENIPYTPTIWASFITGLAPDKHKIKDWWVYDSAVLNKIKHLPLISMIKGKRMVLKALRIRLPKRRIVSKQDLRHKTIFELITPSIAVNVPAYNDKTEYHERLSKALAKSLSAYEEEIFKVHKEKVLDLLYFINKDWKLLMAYFDVADLIGHIYFVKDISRLRTVYVQLDHFAKKLKHKANTRFIIVSDHGMQEHGIFGNHSNYAFYSFNFETSFTPKDFIDFYPMVLKWCMYE